MTRERHNVRGGDPRNRGRFSPKARASTPAVKPPAGIAGSPPGSGHTKINKQTGESYCTIRSRSPRTMTLRAWQVVWRPQRIACCDGPEWPVRVIDDNTAAARTLTAAVVQEPTLQALH